MADKLTFQEIKNFINNETEFILEQDYYINDRTDLKLSCKKCGRIYYRTLMSVKASNRVGKYTECKKCRDYNELYNRIRNYFNEFGDGCILVEKNYIDLKKDKLEIICPICGEHFDCYYNTFKAKQYKMCKPCVDKLRGEKNRYTIDYVKEVIESINGNKLLSTEYIHYDEPIDILCSCGEKYSISLRRFNAGKNTCDKCSNRGIQWNNELVKEYIISQGSEYINQKYINIDTLMEFKCQRCGETYYVSFYNYRKHNKFYCNDCSFEISGEKQRYSYEEVYNMIEETGCHLISDTYIKNTQLLEIECGLCHEIFTTSWAIFKSKKVKACSDCNGKTSAGERIFMDLLDKYKIDYIHQHSYPDCKHMNLLKFDFYLPLFKTIIEIDGRFHREIKEGLGGKEEFELTKLRDKIKNTYCRDNNIPLIRIEYNDQQEDIKIFIKRCENALKNKLKLTSVA